MSDIKDLISVNMDKINDSMSQINKEVNELIDNMALYERGAEQGLKYDAAPETGGSQSILDTLNRIQTKITDVTHNFDNLCSEVKTFVARQGFSKAETMPAAANAIKTLDNLNKVEQPEQVKNIRDIRDNGEH